MFAIYVFLAARSVAGHSKPTQCRRWIEQLALVDSPYVILSFLLFFAACLPLVRLAVWPVVARKLPKQVYIFPAGNIDRFKACWFGGPSAGRPQSCLLVNI